MKLEKGQIIGNYTVLEQSEIPLLDMSVWHILHKSGAHFYYSDRDDGQLLFAVGFATAPNDDTGVFHILEHSCLDGSEKFPLREPFVNLMKTSMLTDLNAYTANEHTVYHFGTINEKDYHNMMSVYLDAVFHPLLLRDRRIFEKEAWRLEPDGQGGIRYNGVVYNEMQAHVTDAESTLWSGIDAGLFPDTCYAKNSGGIPANIPDLTYEKCCEIYKEHYRADNAAFFLMGKMDLEAHLRYIDSVISGAGKPEGKPPVANTVQKNPTVPEVNVEYVAADGDTVDGSSMLGLAYSLPESADSCERLAFLFLSNYLAENIDSPLCKAVLDAGLGQDFWFYVISERKQPIIAFMIKKSNPGFAEKFREVIIGTLKKLTEKGFDREMLGNLVKSHSADVRRMSIEVNVGQRVFSSIIGTQLRDGAFVPYNDIDRLKKRVSANPRYYEELVEKYILESQNCTFVRCVPSDTLAKKRADAVAERLTEIRAGMSDGEYGALVKKDGEFQAYLGAPDSPEALKCLPKLELEDIVPGESDIPAVKKSAKLGNFDCDEYYYSTDLGGFISARLSFYFDGIPLERLMYARLLFTSFQELGANGKDANQIQNEYNAIQTRFSVGTSIYSRSVFDCNMGVNLMLNAPEDKISEAIRLMYSNMIGLTFDRQQLFQIISAQYAQMKDSIMWSGHTVAFNTANSRISYRGAYSEYTGGMTYYRFLRDIVENYDSKADELIKELKALKDEIFVSSRAGIWIAGSDKAENSALDAFAKTIFPKGEASKYIPPVLAAKENIAFAAPTEIGYCVLAGSLEAVGYEYRPQFNLITSWLYSTFFWDEVRAKGGAYGGGVSVSSDNLMFMYSYRDPHVSNTYEIYKKLPAYIRENIPRGRELVDLIISTVADLWKPVSRLDKAAIAFHQVKCPRKYSRAEAAEMIKGITDTDFLDYADMIEKILEAPVCSALSSGDKLKAAGLFEKIQEI